MLCCLLGFSTACSLHHRSDHQWHEVFRSCIFVPLQCDINGKVLVLIFTDVLTNAMYLLGIYFWCLSLALM